MARKIIGVDIGYDSVNLALCRNGEVKKVAVAPMPKGLLREGHITSIQTMSEILRDTLRKNHMHALHAAVVLPNELCFLRTITMPRMTAEQLKYNIPYEFTDYIADEPKNYVFDYAMLSDFKTEDARKGTKSGESGENSGSGDSGNAMKLMAVAAPKFVVDDTRETLGKAGMKMVKMAPVECAYISLIRDAQRHGSMAKEYCILDLGYRSIRMFMFKGDCHMVTRVLEVGLESLDNVIAEAMGVDVHLAHTYFISNYEDCQNKDYCINAYNNIAVELMRALNFYRFSNPDSELNDVWLCGGGVATEPLCKAITETLDMTVHSASELVRSRKKIENWQKFVAAVGVTMD